MKTNQAQQQNLRETERELLGAMLLTPSVLPELAERLTPDHFELRLHRVLFTRLVELWRQREPFVAQAVEAGEPLDLTLLSDRVRGELEEALKAAGQEPLIVTWLSELQMQAAVPAQVPALIEELEQETLKRELHQRLLEAAEAALKDPNEALDQLVIQLRLQSARPSEADAAAAPEPFPEDTMLGLARDFAELYSQAVESPKSFLFASFLTCLGALIGDRVALKAATRNPARLYTVLLGPSGTARKSTAIKLTVGFFQRAVENFPIVRGVGSAEGLAKLIERRNHTNCLLVFDELRAFVDKAKIDGSVMLSVVNTLFEESYAENHTKAHHIELENVHLSMLSACTLDTFSQLFNTHFIAIGFPNRLFLVLDEAKDRKPVPKEVDHHAELGLIQRLGGILARVRGYSPESPLLMELTPEAEARWAEFYHSLPRTVSAIRLDQIGLRLGMLLALSAGKESIDREVIEAVIALCRWELRVREEVMPVDADSAIARMEEKIRRALRSRGPLKERDLKRFVNANRAGLWVYDAAKSNLLRAKELAFDPKRKIFVLLEADVEVNADPGPRPSPPIPDAPRRDGDDSRHYVGTDIPAPSPENGDCALGNGETRAVVTPVVTHRNGGFGPFRSEDSRPLERERVANRNPDPNSPSLNVNTEQAKPPILEGDDKSDDTPDDEGGAATGAGEEGAREVTDAIPIQEKSP